MQKKLIALAVAAAFSAPAFADVTMYGVVDAAVVHVPLTDKRATFKLFPVVCLLPASA